MSCTYETKLEAAQALIRKHGVLRARDLSARGIRRSYFKRLQNQGAIEKLWPGLYANAEFELTETHRWSKRPSAFRTA